MGLINVIKSQLSTALSSRCCRLTWQQFRSRRFVSERNFRNARIQTRGHWVRSENAIHCAMRPPITSMSLPLQTGQLTMDKGSGKDFYNKDPGWHFKVSFNLLSFRLVFAGKKKNWGGWKKMIVLAKCFWDHPLGTFLFQFKISILQPLNVEITICRSVREIDNIKRVKNSTALLFFNKYRTNFDNIFLAM